MPALKLSKTEAQDGGPSAEWRLPLPGDQEGSLLISKAVFDHIPFWRDSRSAPGYWAVYHEDGYYDEKSRLWTVLRRRPRLDYPGIHASALEELSNSELTLSQRVAIRLHSQQFATRKEALQAVNTVLMLLEEDVDNT